MTMTTSPRPLTHAERGRLGGLSTARKHGSTHMEAIGRAGFWATVERHYGGEMEAYMNTLRRHSGPGEFDPLLGCHVLKAN